MNRLYFGDNLEIMREMPSETVDLICTDPPFNSGRNYNAFFAESQAQNKAFTDIWQWDDAAQKTRDDIEKRALSSDTYKVLAMCLKGYDFVIQNAVSGNKGAMRAYLAFMGPRLAEMHRILKESGSVYLHCDPYASHYLKCVFDAVWDQKNSPKNPFFRNEIVWGYPPGGKGPKFGFHRKHDIILFYGKSENKSTFNRIYTELSENAKKKFTKTDKNGRRYKEYSGGKTYLDEAPGRAIPSWVGRYPLTWSNTI